MMEVRSKDAKREAGAFFPYSLLHASYSLVMRFLNISIKEVDNIEK
jgi:hypothetical protein